MLFVELSVPIAHAQGVPDATPPVIEHQPLERATAARRQVITAQVADERVLRDVTLYYRREGESPYRPLTMRSVADSAFFSASIATDPADLRRIEYYLQARDTGGNRTVSGFAFDPWIRELDSATVPAIAAAPSVPAATTVTDPAPTIGIGGVPWWQIALGAVAVGTLAALASGGSGGGGDDGTVPFTLTLSEPQ